ncbi:hypothetical protein Tco_1208852, partial [Tanacetum coccineum]
MINDTWAMEMEHYLEYIDNEVWKVIQNGNSKKRVTKGKDGVDPGCFSSHTENICLTRKKGKSRITTANNGFPKDSSSERFHGMDDAKEILADHKNTFGVRTEKEALMTIDEGQINWVEQTADEEHNHALMAFTVNNELKKYRRIGMKAVKDKDALQKIFDSWSTSSKNLWKLIDCGMSSTVKIGLGYGIKSNAEVLGYEEEISRGIFAFRETDAGNYDIPLYSRFKQVEYKGVPHPLSGDYTPREQEDIDDSLYMGLNLNLLVLLSLMLVPLFTQPVHPMTVMGNKELQNWNQRMERDLGAGYSFQRKPCFVCGSLSHLIKNCDYYEKKMAREAAFKSKRVVHTDVRQATPAWTNSNRVNKANQFTPRPVQLNNIRPNLSTVSRTVNTGHGHVNTGKQHVTSGTQFKSGASRFNTGKQHVNSGSVHVNSGTQIKSGGSRFNTGKKNVNSGRVCVNSARVNRPVSNNTSPNPSQ